MARPSKADQRAEHMRRLEARLQQAQAALERSKAATRARGAVPVPGDIVLSTAEGPEWLVLAVEDGTGDRWLSVPIDESGDGQTLALDDDLAGPISIDPRTARWTSRAVLVEMPRTGVVTDASLERARATVAQSLPASQLTPLGPGAGGRLALRRLARHWPRVVSAIAACVGLLILASLLVDRNERRSAGLYRMRGANGREVGAELAVGGRVCRAKGVADAGACPVAPGAAVEAQYRLDPEVEYRYVLVFWTGERSARRVVFPAGEAAVVLSPTSRDGRERCAGGFCPLVELSGVESGSILWVVFLRESTRMQDLPASDPWSWPGAIPYAFTFEAATP